MWCQISLTVSLASLFWRSLCLRLPNTKFKMWSNNEKKVDEIGFYEIGRSTKLVLRNRAFYEIGIYQVGRSTKCGSTKNGPKNSTKCGKTKFGFYQIGVNRTNLVHLLCPFIIRPFLNQKWVKFYSSCSGVWNVERKLCFPLQVTPLYLAGHWIPIKNTVQPVQNGCFQTIVVNSTKIAKFIHQSLFSFSF